MKLTFFKHRIFLHLTAWLGYFLLLLWFFDDKGINSYFFWRRLFIVVIQAIIFYLNKDVLLPYLFEKKKTILYIISTFGLIGITVSLLQFQKYVYPSPDTQRLKAHKEYYEKKRDNEVQRNKHKHHTNDNHPRNYRPKKKKLGMWQARSLFSSVIAIFPLFISAMYRNSILKKTQEEEKYKLKNKMLEAETKALKSQINPHFLFNTLNNIYTLSQLKSDQTPEVVHRLSEMLQYVIYDSNSDFVKLEDEIKYIQSYVELQLLKDDDIKNVKFDFENVNPNLHIAPMLLIPFVENSFKHSKFEDTQNGWINISISSDGNILSFVNENSIPDIVYSKDRTGGVGLENVHKRLKLLYPEKYTLNVDKGEGEFKVKLEIDLEK